MSMPLLSDPAPVMAIALMVDDVGKVSRMLSSSVIALKDTQDTDVKHLESLVRYSWTNFIIKLSLRLKNGRKFLYLMGNVKAIFVPMTKIVSTLENNVVPVPVARNSVPMSLSLTWREAVRQRKWKLDSMSDYTEPEGLMYRTENGTWGVREDSNSPSCKGFCLNGGQCVRNFPDDFLSCVCTEIYMGKRCETLLFPCQFVNFSPDGKCEGQVCSNEQDCSNPDEQCCPNTCGKKLCTNVRASIFYHPCRQNDFCFYVRRCWISLQSSAPNCNCPIKRFYRYRRCEDTIRQ